MSRDGAIEEKRRTYIFTRAVLNHEPVTLDEVRAATGEYNERMARTDIEAFKKWGCRLALANRTLTFIDSPHTNADVLRLDKQQVEKGLVARIAAALICGPVDAFSFGEPADAGRKRAMGELLQHLAETPGHFSETAKNVRGMLERLGSGADRQHLMSEEEIGALVDKSSVVLDQTKARVLGTLKSYWQESNRLVFLDSGTTNIRIAQILAKTRLPLPNAKLQTLNVCTNSRSIFNILGDERVRIRTIMVGGQQKFQSPTVAGLMAEMFLRNATLLNFGISILGATKVDVDQFAIGSDSQEEASLKTLVMGKSALRIVCVDNTKLQHGVGREAYRFASIDPAHVDLIVTNSPLRSPEEPGPGFPDFRERIHAIESRGVPVLVATQDRVTYGHPDERVDA